MNLTDFQVVIDPGHGGKSNGAVDPANTGEQDTLTTFEDAINLAVSEMVIALLKQQGITAYTTRTSDTDVSLGERSRQANRTDAHVLVSIHCNASTSNKAAGMEIAYHSEEGKKLALIVLACMQQAAPKMKSRGIFPDTRDTQTGFHMLRETRMTAILIELDFLTNPESERDLNDPAMQARYAQGIVRGLVRYASLL